MTLPNCEQNRFGPPQFEKKLLMTIPSEVPAQTPPPLTHAHTHTQNAPSLKYRGHQNMVRILLVLFICNNFQLTIVITFHLFFIRSPTA